MSPEDVPELVRKGAVERISTGLMCIRIGLQQEGRDMLAVADRVSMGSALASPGA